MSAESSDQYGGVIAVLTRRWRLIVCKDGIQWILQHRQRNIPSGWRGRFYTQTRTGLIRVVSEHLGEHETALVKALALPDRIQNWAKVDATKDGPPKADRMPNTVGPMPTLVKRTEPLLSGFEALCGRNTGP